MMLYFYRAVRRHVSMLSNYLNFVVVLRLPYLGKRPPRIFPEPSYNNIVNFSS
jgi:hypothetical protein